MSINGQNMTEAELHRYAAWLETRAKTIRQSAVILMIAGAVLLIAAVFLAVTNL